MPPKSKSKKSKKSKSKTSSTSAITKHNPLESILALKQSTSQYTEKLLYSTPLRKDFVHLSLHLLNCSYVTHEWIFELSTPLSLIIDRVEHSHGAGVIRLFRSPASEENELIDKKLTLAQLGCVGSARYDTSDKPVIRYDMIYDILPKHQGPIVMREPDLTRVKNWEENISSTNVTDNEELFGDRDLDHYEEEKTPEIYTTTIQEKQSLNSGNSLIFNSINQSEESLTDYQ